VRDSRSELVQFSRERILLIFLLIRYTGAKLNEVTSLDPFRDIDCKTHTVVFRKGRGGNRHALREVQIPKVLSVDIQKTVDDPRFKSAREHAFKIDPAHIRRKFYERAQDCGMPREWGAPEVIRKSRAVELMQSNVPLPVVQKILGHSTPNLAASYVEFSNDEIRQVTRYFVDRESERKTSARNAFFGKISDIQRGDIQTTVEIVAVGGYCIRAVITNHSLRQLGLKPGALVAAEVKAPWVMLYKSEKEPDCSAENRFLGTVCRIDRGRIVAEIVVRIPDGTEICSVATEQSRQKLDIQEEDSVWAVFSAFSVVLHAD
jgi:molybdate transport system regulatory protein